MLSKVAGVGLVNMEADGGGACPYSWIVNVLSHGRLSKPLLEETLWDGPCLQDLSRTYGQKEKEDN